MTKTRGVVGPKTKELRPTRRFAPSDPQASFPVYPDLSTILSDAATDAPASVAAHALSILAGYAYSDLDVVAEMMTRLGLEESHCLKVSFDNDPMFIVSTAYVVQSKDGKVVLLGYRGTEPANLISWATNVDAAQVKVSVDTPAGDALELHPGFYRNVRATRYQIMAALMRALEGKSVIPADPGEAAISTGKMEALYITGHSLGGAMAAVMAVLTVLDAGIDGMISQVELPAAHTKLVELGERLRGVYTYGQPMICSPATARFCDEKLGLGKKIFRYVYEVDPIPSLPSHDTGAWGHVGYQMQFVTTWTDHNGKSGTWQHGRSVGQLRFVGALVVAFASFPLSQLLLLQRFPFLYRIDDHRPEHYIEMLTPDGRPTEFGDDPYTYPIRPAERIQRIIEQWGRRAVEVSGPPSRARAALARARRQVSQPSPPRSFSDSILAAVIKPRSLTITSSVSPNLARTVSTTSVNALRSAVLPANTPTATGRPLGSVGSPYSIWALPFFPSRE